jgi:glycerophosphoryl diester phosphodiesterase
MTWNIGHRGAAGLEPENTLRSFRRAEEEGVDALELDLRVTRDGHLVVLHDATVAW